MKTVGTLHGRRFTSPDFTALALAFVAGQVDAAPHELLAYGTRAQTRSDHLQLAMTRLGWRRVDDGDREPLAGWLVERAVEHDAPATLFVLVAEHLRARRMLRPPVNALARMIATARANAHRHVEQLLGAQLATKRRGELDALLAAAADRPALSRTCGGAPRDPGSRSCWAYGVAWLAGSAAIGACYAHSVPTAQAFVVITQAVALLAFMPLLAGR